MKKIIIIGCGESGIGAAILAKKLNFNVFVTDKYKIKKKYRDELISNKIDFEENKHTKKLLLSSDLIIKSPGCILKNEILNDIYKKKIEIISEIEFAMRYNKGKVIAITGSNGKTTTSCLIYNILKKKYNNVKLVGNIGYSFSRSIAKDKNIKYYVLEISSFQLDNSKNIKPYISIILNINVDHMNRYNCLNSYIYSKFNITINQDFNDIFIYNLDNKYINNYILKNNIRNINISTFSTKIKINKNYYNGYLYKNKIFINYNNKIINSINIKKISLIGTHNIYNIIASMIVSAILKIDNKITNNIISNFKCLKHRIQHIKTYNGINFFNDSKSTNIASTISAFKCIKSPIIWITGGIDKGNNYNNLIPYIKKKVKYIICIGKYNNIIIYLFDKMVKKIFICLNMKYAINIIKKISKYKDNILLSPGCASFDLYKNYKDRGNKFISEVNKIFK